MRFPELEDKYHIEYVEWDELFKRSDVLSVHIPIMPATEKIIGAREIRPDETRCLFHQYCAWQIG